jgi:hypothetical protein
LRWLAGANAGFVILALKGIFVSAGRICGENQLNGIAKRAQQGFRGIDALRYLITLTVS